MYTKDEIVAACADQFPIIFKNQDPVPKESFDSAYGKLVDYVIRVSGQSLQGETFKLQWSLLVSSVLLLTIKLFGVASIKVGDGSIKIEYSVVVWYSVFVSALLLAFWLRAAVDFKRFALTREKDSEVTHLPSGVIARGWSNRMMEIYFWNELFDAIGREYDAYVNSKASRLGLSRGMGGISIQTIQIDLVKLSSEDAEMKTKIEGHKTFLAETQAVLTRASNRLQDSVESLFERHRAALASADPLDRPSAFTLSNACEEFFNNTLKPWMDARSELASTEVNASIATMGELPENSRLERQLNLLRNTVAVRKSSFAIEIVLPSLLAVAVVGYALVP